MSQKRKFPWQALLDYTIKIAGCVGAVYWISVPVMEVLKKCQVPANTRHTIAFFMACGFAAITMIAVNIIKLLYDIIEDYMVASNRKPGFRNAITKPDLRLYCERDRDLIPAGATGEDIRRFLDYVAQIRDDAPVELQRVLKKFWWKAYLEENKKPPAE